MKTWKKIQTKIIGTLDPILRLRNLQLSVNVLLHWTINCSINNFNGNAFSLRLWQKQSTIDEFEWKSTTDGGIRETVIYLAEKYFRRENFFALFCRLSLSIIVHSVRQIFFPLMYFLSPLNSSGANPTIASYNPSAVKNYNAKSSQVRFENKIILFYYEKSCSLLKPLAL
jgi:hypothetical protein